MTVNECLSELYEETMHQVFALSANYLMTIPKPGQEERHAKYTERAEILKALIK